MANEKIARATIVLYDGAEQPVAEEFDVLLEIRNNYGVNQSTWVKGPVVRKRQTKRMDDVFAAQAAGVRSAMR